MSTSSWPMRFCASRVPAPMWGVQETAGCWARAQLGSCTPHIGAGTREAQKRIGQELVDIVERFEA